MSTLAIIGLRASVARSRALLEVFDSGSTRPRDGERRRRRRLSAHERELLNSVVIVTVGAWEAYVFDVASEVLVAQIASNMLMLSDPREQRRASRHAVQQHLFRRSEVGGSVGLERVLERMGQTLDWERLDRHVPRSLGKRRRPATALLDDWTERRRRLEHQSGVTRIRREEVEGLVELVELLAAAMDAVAEIAKTEQRGEPVKALPRAA